MPGCCHRGVATVHALVVEACAWVVVALQPAYGRVDDGTVDDVQRYKLLGAHNPRV